MRMTSWTESESEDEPNAPIAEASAEKTCSTTNTVTNSVQKEPKNEHHNLEE